MLPHLDFPSSAHTFYPTFKICTTWIARHACKCVPSSLLIPYSCLLYIHPSAGLLSNGGFLEFLGNSVRSLKHFKKNSLHLKMPGNNSPLNLQTLNLAKPYSKILFSKFLNLSWNLSWNIHSIRIWNES